MKKFNKSFRIIALVAVIGLSMVVYGFSQSNNYANGNGTIVETKTDGNVKWVIRKHIQNIEIGDFTRDFNIYDKPVLGKGTVVGKIKLKDKLKVTQVAEALVSNNYYFCVNITTDKKATGWIFGGKFGAKDPDTSWRVPYLNNRWEITETIKVGGKSWTARKMPGGVCVWDVVVNIRDKPGVTGTKVISKIVPPKNAPQVFVDIIEATEQGEIIDGHNDMWLKITYNGVKGWVFGGYTTVERGGYKYWTPENIISWNFGSI